MSVIQKIKFHEVIVPAKKGMINSLNVNKPLHMLPVGSKSSWSLQFDELPKLIIEIFLDNGIVGIGEFYRDANKEIVNTIAQDLIGVSVEDLNLSRLDIPLYREYDGFECALWDAYAKTHNMPLYALLGGKSQNKVKVGAWTSWREVSEMGDIAEYYHKQGFDCLKLKADLGDDIIGWLKSIDKKAKGMRIIIDPNKRWENLGETKQLLKELESIGNVLCLEDPMPHWMLEEYHLLRQMTTLRIVRHISLPYVSMGQRVEDIINIMHRQSVDGFNFNGGLGNFSRLAHVAEMANMYFWHGSEIDLGILEAMYIHQSAASSHCIWPSDIFGDNIREHSLLENPLEIKDSYVNIPEGSGLGIKLDKNALNKYTTNHWEVI